MTFDNAVICGVTPSVHREERDAAWDWIDGTVDGWRKAGGRRKPMSRAERSGARRRADRAARLCLGVASEAQRRSDQALGAAADFRSISAWATIWSSGATTVPERRLRMPRAIRSSVWRAMVAMGWRIVVSCGHTA